MSRHVILRGTARGPPTFVAGACAVNVRDSFVPSSSVTETVVGPACDGAAVATVPQAGRAIGAGVKQTCVTLRPPALETSANRTSPAWKLDERPPAKIAWIRSDGDCDCDCADATAGLRAAPAIRAPTTARMAVGRKGAPSLRGTVRLLPPVNARTHPEVATDRSPGSDPGGLQLARDPQVLAQHRQVVAGEAADRRVAAVADLVLGLLDVLDVVLDLEVGVRAIEHGAAERAHRPQLPLLARRRRLRHVDAEPARRALGVLQRRRVVLHEAGAERLHGGGRALGLRGRAADDLEAVALDAGREPRLVLRGGGVAARAGAALLQGP